MLRKTGLFTILATMALAAPLHAADHYVILLDTGYFPALVHPVPGDTILFYNHGELPMAATAQDESWSTGLLAPGESFTLPVTEGMKQVYNNLVPGTADADTTTSTTPVITAVGQIDYLNPAPVDLGADGKPVILADEAYAD